MSGQTQPTRCRLLIDPPASGAWNMAVDEALLNCAVEAPTCCWRFYRWEQPTLSLGYFQSFDDRRRHPASRDCPVVRRASGGGAILHDAELTYSLVLPAAHPLTAGPRRLYETVHVALVEALAELGIRASLLERSDPTTPAGEPFLCFQRRAAGDVLIDGNKIAGSAQRRRRGAVLQHGSVLLARSPAAPELDGLADISGSCVDCRRLIRTWLRPLAGRLALTFDEQPFSQQQRQQAAALVQSKYGSAAWTIGRGR